MLHKVPIRFLPFFLSYYLLLNGRSTYRHISYILSMVRAKLTPLHHSPKQILHKQIPKQKGCQYRLPKLPKQTKTVSPNKCAENPIPKQILP